MVSVARFFGWPIFILISGTLSSRLDRNLYIRKALHHRLDQRMHRFKHVDKNENKNMSRLEEICKRHWQGAISDSIIFDECTKAMESQIAFMFHITMEPEALSRNKESPKQTTRTCQYYESIQSFNDKLYNTAVEEIKNFIDVHTPRLHTRTILDFYCLNVTITDVPVSCGHLSNQKMSCK